MGAHKHSKKPIALVEIKPSIGANIRVVDGQHLGQILVQGYYAVNQYNCTNLLIALTDTTTSHCVYTKMGKKGTLELVLP